MGLYDAFYNCHRPPFSVVPDPQFLFLAAAHGEALAQLLYAVESRKGIMVLTGEVGTGKTLLLRSLLERIGPRIQAGYLLAPPRTVAELYAAISAALEVKLDPLNPTHNLNAFLTRSLHNGVTVVLLFDEAQRLTDEVLEQIRLLSNLETKSEKLVQLIFAGQQEFDLILERPELRALRQRIAMRCHLSPLNCDETIQYIATRLKIAGARQSAFTFAACESVYRFTHGIPRLINVVCDNAMITGYAMHQPVVDEELIEMAAADLRLEPALKPPSRIPAAIQSLRRLGRRNSTAAPGPPSRSRGYSGTTIRVVLLAITLFFLLVFLSGAWSATSTFTGASIDILHHVSVLIVTVVRQLPIHRSDLLAPLLAPGRGLFR